MIFEQLGRLLDLRCENKSNFHARYASGAEVLPDFWVFFVRNETKEVSIWNFIMFSTDVDNIIFMYKETDFQECLSISWPPITSLNKFTILTSV